MSRENLAMNNSTDKPVDGLKIYFHREDIATAEKMAVHHNSSSIRQRVYFDALALLAVRRSLKPWGIIASLEDSYSWNPAIRELFGAKDLLLPGTGRLNCVAVCPSDTSFEALNLDLDAVACVVVQLGESPTQAKILGYLPVERLNSRTRIEISELESYEVLIEQILADTFIPVPNELCFTDSANVVWIFVNSIQEEQEEPSLSTAEFTLEVASADDSDSNNFEIRANLFSDQDFRIDARIYVMPQDSSRYEVVAYLYPVVPESEFPGGLELSIFRNSELQFKEVTEEFDGDVESDPILFELEDTLTYRVSFENHEEIGILSLRDLLKKRNEPSLLS
jgi:hypothetical protein